ncbi:MAG TPA: superoxide dismutase, Ni [Verrucomicrobiae bacterium]|nr:superoxide dismutase, Ni [Verrucomicrobiae bacterium]
MFKDVEAHCDLPCGIYETDTLRHAAATVKRMMEKIAALGELDSVEKYNTFVRAVKIKEEHAQKVKEQVYILWSDYFKPEHLEQFPDLHDILWKTAKQAGKTKQTVSLEEAEALNDMVHKVVHLFADSQK